MEAVPRLPMLSFDIKSSTECPSFGPKLKQYIRDFYNEDPEMYSNEIHNLEGIRAQAVCAVRSAAGCQALKRYYCQLHFLQSRFPMVKDGAAAVAFTWQDTYTSMVCSLADIRFEMVCILYNIGALHSQLGASDSRVSPNGMKMCCTHFQCAAWAFQHLKETYPQPAGVDLAPNVMQFMYQLTMAQAQECILEKSMLDNRKSTIIAKVAVQVVDYYNLAMLALEQGGADECSVGDTVGSKLYKNWKRYVKFKTVYHSAISLLYHGQQSEDQQKMGERVTYYQAASDKLKEAMKLSKGMDEVEAVNEALAFTMDVIEGKKKAAKNENEFIYHEVVPDREALQEVRGASLVQGIAFNVNDTEISGPDIFARLVPMKAHEASSLYSEEKAKLRRKVGTMIDEKDDQLMRFMSSLQLEQLNSNIEEDDVPQELVDRCAALSAKPNAIPSLNEAMNKLADVSADVESMLQDMKELLEMEEQREKEYVEVMGKRPPSIAATDLTREAKKYQEAHAKASESNQTLHKAMMMHIPNLRNLSVSLADLQRLIPTVTVNSSLQDDAIVKRLQLLVAKVDEMRQQRAMLANSLRTATSRDDITAQLVTRTSDSLDTIFDQEMQKHQRIVATIEQNLAAQDNILKEITESYPHYVAMKKDTDEKLRGRRTLINGLIASYDAYEDLLAKSAKGLEFYRKLETNVTKLLQRVKGTCRVQDEERDLILARNYKSIPSGSPAGSLKTKLPSEPAPTKSGPKLKDYLQGMKMGGGQVPAAGYPAGYYPPANYPATASPAPAAYYEQPASSDGSGQWVPSVRPAPVGQEGSEQTASACYNSNTDSKVKSTTPQHGYSYAGKTNTSQAYYNNTGGQYAANQAYPTVSTPGYNYNNQYQPTSANAASAYQPSSQGYNTASMNQSSQAYAQSTPGYAGQTAQGANYTAQGSASNATASSTALPGQTYNTAQSQPYNPAQTYNPSAAQSGQAYGSYQAPAGPTSVPSAAYPTSAQAYATGTSSTAYATGTGVSGSYTTDQSHAYTTGATAPGQGYAYGASGTAQGYNTGASGTAQGYITGTAQGYTTGATGTAQGYTTGTSGTAQGYTTGTAQGYATGATGTAQGYTTGTAEGYAAGTGGTAQGYTTGTAQGYAAATGGATQGYTAQASGATQGYTAGGTNSATQSSQNYSATYGQQATTPSAYQYPPGSYSAGGAQSNYSSQQSAQQQAYPTQVTPQHIAATPSQTQSYYPQSSTPQPANTGQYPADSGSQTNSYTGHPGYSYNSTTGQYDYTSGYQTNQQTPHPVSNQGSWPQTSVANASSYVAQQTGDGNYSRYTSAGNSVTSSSQSSTEGQGQYNASGYSQGNYYTLPYGYQDGASSTPLPAQSPQQTGHSGQQATSMHAGPNSNTSTTNSQSTLALSSSTDSSNVDLLAGLDFTVSVAPLMPQAIEKPKPMDSPKKVNGSSQGDLINRGAAVEQKPVEKSSLLNEVPITEAIKSVENKLEIPVSFESQEDGKLTLKGKDPYADPEALNQFVQEVEKYEKFVDGLTTKTLNGPTPLDMKWKELMDLQEKDANRHSISVARCYPMKNRFPDILPYDASRVEMPSTKDDYINASYVRDMTPLTPPFIVTQAPLPSTYTDFWTMVWEQQVEVIVCLLSDAELQEQVYWPVEKGQELAAGKMKLTLQSSEVRPHWVERIVSLCFVETRATRVIVHLQFTAWPGSSFPPSPGPFLGFVSEALNFYSQQRGSSHPVVAHCLSGVGRSGLFCLITAALCEIQAGRGLLELVQVTARMSTARKGSLRDREHLKFAYQAMLYYAQDMLMKRGILTSRSTFDDKRSRGSKGHTRHPSEDFLLGPPTDLSQLQSGIEKMGLVAANKTRSYYEKQASQESLLSKPSQSGSSICSSVSSSGRSSPLGHSLMDLSRLSAKTEQSTGKSKKRYTRESFTSNQSNTGLDIKSEIGTDDPLSQLDPLWRMK